jgi:hypothetical protein
MTGAHATAVRAVVEESVVRIEIHLVRLAQGHDPMGHLFAIERLARSARSEWWCAQHESERAAHKR